MSGRRQIRRRRRPAGVATKSTTPWWTSFLIAAAIFTMLVVSINYRAFSEMSDESDKHARLATQIQSLMDENLALQEEIHNLKTNREVIRREAKRLGLRE